VRLGHSPGRCQRPTATRVSSTPPAGLSSSRHHGAVSGISDRDSTGPQQVVARVERLAESADRRWQLLLDAHQAAGIDADVAASPAAPRGARERARELRDHSHSFLLPRARDLEAPVLVVIVGPTGSGKSSLLNALAEAPVSRTGVLRPTTRDAVVIGSTADLARSMDDGALGRISPERLQQHVTDAYPGLLVVDTPDVDSVEHEDRALADRMLEAADLCIFVTTATRYADRVPWDVLARAEERRLDLVVVLNRMPPGDDAPVVLEDLDRLLRETGLRVRSLLTVPDGALADDGLSLARSALEPLVMRLKELSADAAKRRELVAAALAGALEGVVPLVSAVAGDLEQEAREARTLLEQAQAAYDEETAAMLDRLFSGSLLREEVIRHWHTFVGADQVTRFFASGIGRIRGTVAAVLRGAPPAPVGDVQRGASEDITALVERHAAEAARRTASRWSVDQRGALLVAAHPDLWSSSTVLDAAVRRAVDGWIASIAADVAERGASRRNTARVAAVGVNVLTVALMLVTFTHTGGLTGAEAGIAAATAFLNQKLLNALFGEAAVQEMSRRARQRLTDALQEVLADERRRFEGAVGPVADVEVLAAELRDVAA
jgi:energy-coupling factor transporter ATP-binding protein EcfA2